MGKEAQQREVASQGHAGSDTEAGNQTLVTLAPKAIFSPVFTARATRKRGCQLCVKTLSFVIVSDSGSVLS